MKIDLVQLKIDAQKNQQENKKFLAKLKKKKPKKLDSIVQELHNYYSKAIDCLECANCCKSISPIITEKDIDRLCKPMKLKPTNFIDQYLYLDEDNDYVYKQTPCPFLDNDNYCFYYENRPKACREYPHTDRKRFYQIANITLKNTFYCPIVFHVLEDLKKRTDLF